MGFVLRHPKGSFVQPSVVAGCTQPLHPSSFILHPLMPAQIAQICLLPAQICFVIKPLETRLLPRLPRLPRYF
jgi:hypothetical protein